MLSQAKVLDEEGSSGRSFMQFVRFLQELRWEDRPQWILLECVSNLAKQRSCVQERSTTVATGKLAELGFEGQWKAPLLKMVVSALMAHVDH